MLETITGILNRCGLPDSVIPPTELYNEGWMLRLVLDWFDRNREINSPLAFAPGAAGTLKHCCLRVSCPRNMVMCALNPLLMQMELSATSL